MRMFKLTFFSYSRVLDCNVSIGSVILETPPVVIPLS